MNRALDHLQQLGHHNVAYANARATYFSHYSVTERYETLLSGARKRNMELVEGHDRPFSAAVDFLRDAVIERRATALISYDHHIAVALVGAASELGLRIPQDFSVVCFNDVFPVALLPPPLTAVRVSGREMGRIGADLLLNSMLATKPHAARELRVSEDLVVRSSTAPPKQ
jgi:DNA-binding LacI/PurR family transcriptional regulator